MSRRLVTFGVPGLLMLALGLIGAGRPVLSWDEVATADVASRTPGQIWNLIHHVDAVFGPYYFLEHYWTTLDGHSAVSLRLPSILAMAGTAALVGTLGRRYFGTPAGLVAGVLFCLLPTTSRYAAEARPYAFACFFSLLALLLLERALDRPRWWRWVAYAAAVAFVGLSHVIALTTLAAHLVLIVRRGSRRTAVMWTASAGVALLALVPLLLLGVSQRGTQLWWVPKLSPTLLRDFPGEIVGTVAAGWLLIGLAVVGLCRPIPHRAELAAMLFAPLVVVGLLSVLVTPYWVARYLLIVLAPMVLLAAGGLTDALFRVRPAPAVRPALSRTPVADLVGSPPIGAPVSPAPISPAPVSPAPVSPAPAPVEPKPHPVRRWVLPAAATLGRLVLVLALIGAAVWPGEKAVRAPDAKAGNDYRTAATIVRQNQLPGDGIIFTGGNNRTMRAGLDYYLPRGPQDVLVARTGAAAGQLHAIENTPSRSLLAHNSRLWLFLDGHHANPLTVRKDLVQVFKGQFRLDRIWFPRNATLALYSREHR